MKTETANFNKESQAREYLDLVQKYYQEQTGFDYSFGDIQRGLEYSLKNSHQQVHFITVRNNERLIAHIALILDDRLPVGEAFFGFMEFPEDMAVFRKLWDELLKIAETSRIQKISGPVNGSIWHSYRVIKSDNSQPRFVSEPLCQSWYYSFLKEQYPDEEIAYHSGIRQNLENIISLTKPSYEALVDRENLRIERLESPDPPTIKELYHLSRLIFQENWGYVDLSENEFYALYNSGKVSSYIGSIYLVHAKDELVGFCSTLREKNSLILKTMGILSDWQGRGLGNALVHKIHWDAQQKGISSMIYALIRDTNQIRNFPRDDARVIREYACLSYKIHQT